MTMQVGMVGSDGVLIASDTRVMNDNVNSGPSEGSYLPRQTVDESRKIIVNHEHGIAISLAKSMDTAKRVAASVVSGLRREDFAYPCESIQAIGAVVLKELKQLELSGIWRNKEAHCLIALTHPSPRLYLFRLDSSGEEFVPICEPLKRSLAVGDHANAAIFWKERYYRRKQPIKKLVPLAAHLIVSASKLNPGGIKGLEIVLCNATGLHRIAEKSIRELATQANRWDKEIGSLFSDYKIKLGFDPKKAA